MAEKNVDFHIHTNEHTKTEKVIRDTLPSYKYAIRNEKAYFPRKTQEKRLSAARCALRARHHYCCIRSPAAVANPEVGCAASS